MSDTLGLQSGAVRASASSALRHPLLNPVRQVLGIFLSATAVTWLVRLLVQRDPVEGGWAVQVMLAIAAFLAVCWGAADRYRTWTLPMRKLESLVRRAHAGEVPIEELAEVEGGPRAIVPAIQELLREIRSQQASVVALEVEVRQRIANRTEAMERTIGSLRAQATRDALTGLFNRRFLDDYLAQSVQRHVKERKDLCLLMIDVDHFKVLNDTLGHAAGDDLLRAIGQLIRSAARGEDVGFRAGGDEFVVLLPNSNADAGRVLGERLTSMVDALAKTLRVPKRPRLSVGMITLKETPERTPDALLDLADKALYELKRQRQSLREGLNEPAAGVQSPPLSRKPGLALSTRSG